MTVAGGGDVAPQRHTSGQPAITATPTHPANRPSPQRTANRPTAAPSFTTTPAPAAPSFPRRRESSIGLILVPCFPSRREGAYRATLLRQRPLPSGEGTGNKNRQRFLDSRLRGNDGCRGRGRCAATPTHPANRPSPQRPHIRPTGHHRNAHTSATPTHHQQGAHP